MRVIHSHDLYWTGTTRPRCSITIYVCSISPDTCSSRWSHRQFRRIIVIIIDMRSLIKCQVQSVIRKNKTSVDLEGILVFFAGIPSLTEANTRKFWSLTIRDQNVKSVTLRVISCWRKFEFSSFFFFFSVTCLWCKLLRELVRPVIAIF